VVYNPASVPPLRSRQHRGPSAWRRARALALAALVCGVGLVPLFGDPRTTAFTHPLWARLLLRALETDGAVRLTTEASQVFAALAWRDSLSYPADRYLEARDAVVRGGALVPSGAVPAEVTYLLAVVEPGAYQLRARLAGGRGLQASAEIVPLGGGSTVEAFTLPLPGQSAWVFGGSARLAAGAYGARFLLPPGCALARVEVAPPCLDPIEPPGGWRPTAVTSRTDLAVTTLRAVEREDELPPAASPVEIEADAFQVEAPAVPARAGVGVAPLTLRAGHAGLRAVAAVELPDTGRYVVSALISPGAGQRWMVDACRSASVCAGGEIPGWRVILSQDFSAGRHLVEVTLGDGASLEAVRFERKLCRPDDYVAALARLGLDTGREGPVSRATALDAARFVRERRRILGAECLQRLPIEEPGPTAGARVAADRGPTEGPGPVPPPPPPEAPAPVPPPVGPPILPPQEVATPTQPGGGS
jgi:hypothetical protein